MSHPEQRIFCRQVRRKYPEHFRRVLAADVGSLDINGNNRGLFKRSVCFGIDVVPGENVDVVGPAHVILPGLVADANEKFDTIVSTEALEHDKYFEKTLCAMYDCLKSGGFLLITAAR